MPQYLIKLIAIFLVTTTVAVAVLSYQTFRLLRSARVTIDHSAQLADKLQLAQRSEQVATVLDNLAGASENTRRITGGFTEQDIRVIKRYYLLQNESLLETIRAGKTATHQLNATLETTRRAIEKFGPVIRQAESALTSGARLANTLETQVARNGARLETTLEETGKLFRGGEQALQEIALTSQQMRFLLASEIPAAIAAIQSDLEKAGQLIESIKVITDREIPAALASAITSLKNVELISGDLAAFTRRNLNPDPPKSRLGRIARSAITTLKLATAIGQLTLIITTISR